MKAAVSHLALLLDSIEDGEVEKEECDGDNVDSSELDIVLLSVSLAAGTLARSNTISKLLWEMLPALQVDSLSLDR